MWHKGCALWMSMNRWQGHDFDNKHTVTTYRAKRSAKHVLDKTRHKKKNFPVGLFTTHGPITTFLWAFYHHWSHVIIELVVWKGQMPAPNGCNSRAQVFSILWWWCRKCKRLQGARLVSSPHKICVVCAEGTSLTCIAWKHTWVGVCKKWNVYRVSPVQGSLGYQNMPWWKLFQWTFWDIRKSHWWFLTKLWFVRPIA